MQSVGSYAFYACPSLKSVHIPSGVSVGDYAFGYEDSTETDKNGALVPKKTEGFHRTQSLPVAQILFIVLGSVSLLAIIIMLIKIIRNNQISKAEENRRREEKEAAEEAAYIGIAESGAEETEEETDEDETDEKTEA